MNLGNAILTLRKEQRVSRKELAERSSLSVTALYNIENNISFPSKDTIDKICNSLSIPNPSPSYYSILLLRMISQRIRDLLFIIFKNQ